MTFWRGNVTFGVFRSGHVACWQCFSRFVARFGHCLEWSCDLAAVVLWRPENGSVTSGEW